MLIIAITCTDKDITSNTQRLAESIKNFNFVFSSEVFFLVVFQSVSGDSGEVKELFSDLSSTSYEILAVPYLSVSRARNDALFYAKSGDYQSIIFHDASLIYTIRYLEWVKERKSYSLLSSCFAFTDSIEGGSEMEGESFVKFNDFRDIFVCSYVFPLDVEIPYFDERFGPGCQSIYNSGEDFLFMRKFFYYNPQLKSFLRYDGHGILHPFRPKDYSKHLAYAEGQGKIHQIFLLEEKSVYALWRCILFFGNALARVIFLKKNAFKILLLRLKGFCDFKLEVKKCFYH